MNKEVIIPGLYSPREVAIPKCNVAFANKIEFISRNNFVNKVENMAEQYQQKAEVIGASFESEMATKIGMLNERITSLNNNVDYLNSSFEIDAHL